MLKVVGEGFLDTVFREILWIDVISFCKTQFISLYLAHISCNSHLIEHVQSV